MDNIIAVDGPAGSGKSTVARLLARRLKFFYIDTGAMYRAFTLKAIMNDIDLEDKDALFKLAQETELDIINDDALNIKVMLDNEDVTSLIRTPELTNKVTYIARVPEVREIMKLNQQKIGTRGKCVFEGRDIGTVVFPNAKYKFYIDANFSERVNRRHKELIEKGKELSFEDVAKDLKSRDDKDINRKVGPLKQAEDATYVDTTDISIEKVVDKLIEYIK